MKRSIDSASTTSTMPGPALGGVAISAGEFSAAGPDDSSSPLGALSIASPDGDKISLTADRSIDSVGATDVAPRQVANPDMLYGVGGVIGATVFPMALARAPIDSGASGGLSTHTNPDT